MSRHKNRPGNVQLNVQPPLSADVARYVDHRLRADFHRNRADTALAEARQLLDNNDVSYREHLEVGDTARCIVAATAIALRQYRHRYCAQECARARLRNSLTSQAPESSPVSVEVNGGAPASRPA